MSAADLRTQLRSGKTLAQIAQATDGKTVDGLVAAMVDAAKQKLAAAVSAGKLTQAQADTLGAQLNQRITDLVNGQRPAGPAQRHGRGPGGDLSAAASYLGLSAADLRTQLRSGKTLAQIAQATDGKTVDGLVAAMVDAAKQKLAAAVSAGKLTQAQADTLGAQLNQRITDLVNGQRPVGPSVPPPGARGPIHGGFGFGGAPSSGTTT